MEIWHFNPGKILYRNVIIISLFKLKRYKAIHITYRSTVIFFLVCLKPIRIKFEWIQYCLHFFCDKISFSLNASSWNTIPICVSSSLTTICGGYLFYLSCLRIVCLKDRGIWYFVWSYAANILRNINTGEVLLWLFLKVW